MSLSTTNIITGFCIIIGFALSGYSSYELYVTSHQTDNCIITTLNYSIIKDSNNKKILNASVIDEMLPSCKTISTSDIPYSILQLGGLFVPVIIVLVTMKREDKKPNYDAIKKYFILHLCSKTYNGIPRTTQ